MTTPLTTVEFSTLLTPIASSFPLAVAVSGGPDSMALALLADGFARERGGEIVALTVDHGLRPESGAEAAQVAAWLGARGIEHHILSPQQPISGSLQHEAREARYRLMADYCHAHGISRLLLAHHRGDQAETVLLRVRRGSHIEGLAAMRPRAQRHGVLLLRPLLSCPKSRLRATLEALGQPWTLDPTNALPRYDRNRLRAMLAALPDPEETCRKLADAAAQLSRLRDEREAETEQWLGHNAHFAPNGAATLDAAAFADLPPDPAFRVLSTLLRRVSSQPYPPRFSDLERLHAALSGPHCRRTLHECMVERRGNKLHISREFPTKSG